MACLIDEDVYSLSTIGFALGTVCCPSYALYLAYDADKTTPPHPLYVFKALIAIYALIPSLTHQLKSNAFSLLKNKFIPYLINL